LIDAFAAQAKCCRTDPELRRLLEDVTRVLGFRYFALLHHASLRCGAF